MDAWHASGDDLDLALTGQPNMSIGGIPVIVIVIGAVVLIMLIRTASIHRQHSLDTDQRLCRGCGTSHPAYAQFCRRCGRRL